MSALTELKDLVIRTEFDNIKGNYSKVARNLEKIRIWIIEQNDYNAKKQRKYREKIQTKP